MSRIGWNLPGERFFEAGVDQCVFYPKVGAGVPWNGIVSVSENTSGGEVESLYYDGVKYLDVIAGEDFEATLEAFYTPPEFDACDGQKAISPGLFVTQQPRKTFGLCYRTLIGNDLEGEELGYKLHIVYNCTAAPAGRSNKTIAATAAPDPRSWTILTVPPPATTFRPTAHLVMDSTKMPADILQGIETMLYGRDAAGTLLASDPMLPTIAQIVAVFDNKITPTIEALV